MDTVRGWAEGVRTTTDRLGRNHKVVLRSISPVRNEPGTGPHGKSVGEPLVWVELRSVRSKIERR